MDLQYVEVSAQSAHAGVHRIENVLPGQANPVDPVAVVPACGGDRRLLASVVDSKIALGQDDYTVARDVVLCQGLSDDFLGATVGVDVGLFFIRGGLRVSVMLMLCLFWSCRMRSVIRGGKVTHCVPGVDSTLVCVLDQGKGLVLV